MGTLFVPGFGAEAWHHVASLAVVLALAVLLRKSMQSRRFLGIGVLATTVLAAVSGFYLLYWKEGIRADGYQDWGVFWHVAWSWAAAVFFWQHTWVNRVAFAHFFRRSIQALRPALVHVALYALAVAALVLTAGPGRAWFTNETYIPLSLWTWLVAIVAAYLAWLLLRRRPSAAQKRFRGRVDLALVPLAAVAVVSGLPLLFFDEPLNRAGLQYASKFWHVGPSIAFSVIVYVHSVQLWNATRRHWQRIGKAPRASLPPSNTR